MHEARSLRVVLVSIAVCVFVGIPLGTFLGGLFTSVPSLVLRRDIAGIPVLAYAFITAGPLGTIAGVAGGLVVLAFVRAKYWDPPWPSWALAGATAGALLAGVMPLLLSATGWNGQQGGVLAIFGLFATTGALCGALLGVYGWLEKRGAKRA